MLLCLLIAVTILNIHFTEVGFNPPRFEFTVSESAGTLNITVGLILGKLRSEVQIDFSIITSDSDAVGNLRHQLKMNFTDNFYTMLLQME